MDAGDTYSIRSLHDFDEELTRRELLVLKLAAKGFSNKAIADKIFRCVKQVEHDLAEVCYKLKAVNMKNAINIAWERGILRREE